MSDAKNIYERDSKALDSGRHGVEWDDLVFRDVNAIHTASRENLWSDTRSGISSHGMGLAQESATRKSIRDWRSGQGPHAAHSSAQLAVPPKFSIQFSMPSASSNDGFTLEAVLAVVASSFQIVQ